MFSYFGPTFLSQMTTRLLSVRLNESFSVSDDNMVRIQRNLSSRILSQMTTPLLSDSPQTSFRLTPEEVSLSQTVLFRGADALRRPERGKGVPRIYCRLRQKTPFRANLSRVLPAWRKLPPGPGARWFSNIVI